MEHDHAHTGGVRQIEIKFCLEGRALHPATLELNGALAVVIGFRAGTSITRTRCNHKCAAGGGVDG